MATGGVKHPSRDDLQGGFKESGLPPVSGSRKTVGGGVQASDDGRGAFLQGKTSCPSTLLGVRGGDGVRM